MKVEYTEKLRDKVIPSKLVVCDNQSYVNQ